jgi:opacity protein-like surface antigen
MKNLKILFVSCLFCIFAGLEAQVFVGGNLGLNSNGGSTKVGTTTTDKTKYFSFNINPMAGYFLSDKLSVGAMLNFGSSKQTIPGTPEEVNTTTSFGLTPFARYYPLTFQRFSVFGEATIGISNSNQKNKTGATTNQGPKTTNLGFSVYPGIEYALSDKIHLETSINILRLSLNSSTSKQTIANEEQVDKTTSFSFGAGLNNVVNVGSITIGAYYKL